MKNTSYYLLMVFFLSLISINSVQADILSNDSPESDHPSESESSPGMDKNIGDSKYPEYINAMLSSREESDKLDRHLDLIKLVSSIISKIDLSIVSNNKMLDLTSYEQERLTSILNGDRWLKMDDYAGCTNADEKKCSELKVLELEKMKDRVKKYQDDQIKFFLDKMRHFDETSTQLHSNRNQFPSRFMFFLTDTQMRRYLNILEILAYKIKKSHDTKGDRDLISAHLLSVFTKVGYLLAPTIGINEVRKKKFSLISRSTIYVKIALLIQTAAIAIDNLYLQSPKIKLKINKYNQAIREIDDANLKIDDIILQLKKLADFYQDDLNEFQKDLVLEELLRNLREIPIDDGYYTPPSHKNIQISPLI